MKNKRDNYAEVTFEAISENEAFARIVVAGFIMPLDPTIDQLNELKTIVSEGVTNSVIHAYDSKGGKIKLILESYQNDVTVTIIDYGKGIEDINKARELFYTSKPEEERSGMGLTLMEVFSDEFYMSSKVGEGTVIKIKKSLELSKEMSA
ncbi:MAG: anti-sigma factor [Haloplasmataceae bacterium]|jgi:stage II sporulation protein AB (anti-sigma F factor)|nr:anti-sigma factor [Haloplasmataceae bacterium]